jgi:hypothetical protein
VTDVDFTMTATFRVYLLVANLTAQRTWTFPRSSTCPQGFMITLGDGGGINGANNIKLAIDVHDANLLGAGVVSNTYIMGVPGSSTSWHTDGLGNWILCAKSYDNAPISGVTASGPVGYFKLGNIIVNYGEVVATITGVTGLFAKAYTDAAPAVTLGSTNVANTTAVTSVSKTGVVISTVSSATETCYYNAIGT